MALSNAVKQRIRLNKCRRNNCTAWRWKMERFLSRGGPQIRRAALSTEHLEPNEASVSFGALIVLGTHHKAWALCIASILKLITREDWYVVRDDLSVAVDKLLERKGWTIRQLTPKSVFHINWVLSEGNKVITHGTF